MDVSLYYNPNKMLSYNRILNFIIGARGLGKSYAMKEYPIKRFIKYGEQMIYLKRHKDDLKYIGRYFDDIKDKFPDHEFKVKGKELYIDGKLFAWAIPLSIWQRLKSNAFPNVTTIVYDEFLKEKDTSHYIPNEPQALLNVMDTVFRDRENARCICLSNAVTIVNPFFLYFGLIPNTKKRFNAYESILVEIPDSVEFAEERKKTRFGKLINGTEYGEMSLNNEFINDSKTFIEKRTKESRFQFSIVYNGMTMGIWVDTTLGQMYLSHDYDPSSKLSFALTQDDLDESNTLMNNWKSNYYLNKMGRAFMKGALRFDNQVLRNVGYEMFKKMRVQ